MNISASLLANFRRLARLLPAVMLAAVLAGCGSELQPPEVVRGTDGVLCFAFSPSDYIDSFNSLDTGAAMRPASSWMSLTETEAFSPFFGWSVLRFKPDENCLNDPAVTLFPSSDGTQVRALTFDFDDHAYSEYSLKEFRRYCVGSIQLLTGQSERTAEALFERLYLQAADGAGWYPDGSGIVPRVMYCCGNAGFFPYFRNGCMLRICAVPTDEESISLLEASGAEIYYVEDLIESAGQS